MTFRLELGIPGQKGRDVYSRSRVNEGTKEKLTKVITLCVWTLQKSMSE